MPSWGNATLLEAAWTLVALIGVGATGYGTWIAWRDARQAERWLRRMAFVLLRYESALFLIELVFLIAGVRACSLPPPERDIPLDWGTVLVGLLFLMSGVIIAGVSVQNRIVRHQMNKGR